MVYCIFYTDVCWCKVNYAPVSPDKLQHRCWVWVQMSDSDSPQRNSSSPPSSWSTQFWPSSCSLAACSSSMGSQTHWHPDDNLPPCTSWTTERRPLRGLSMPCSPGRRLDSVSAYTTSLYHLIYSCLTSPADCQLDSACCRSAAQHVIY